MRCLFTIIIFFNALTSFSQNVVFTNFNLKSYLLTENSVDTNGDEYPDTIIDTNGDNEIQISEALAVQNLVIATGNRIISSIQDIYKFSNLKKLTLYGDFELKEISELSLDSLEFIRVSDHNSIRNIDLSDLPNLKSIILEGLDGVQTLNLQNGSFAEDAFSLFYTYVEYACVDSIEKEYSIVAQHIKNGGKPAIDCVLSIDENEKIQTVLYPNPAHETINILSDLPISKLEIYDISGKIVRCNLLPTGSIDIGNLVKGVYSLSIEFNNGHKIRKKIIKK